MPQYFTVGNVMSQSFSLFFRSFPTMLIIAVVSSLVSVVTLFYPENYLLVFGSLFVSLLISSLIQACVVYGIYQLIIGQKMKFGESFNHGLSRYLPVVGAAILFNIIVGIGTFFFFIPGMILYCMFWVVIPIVVIEKAGVPEAFSRSRELTKGKRMKVFGILFLFGLMAIFVGAFQAGLPFVLQSYDMVPGSLNYVLIQIPFLILCSSLPGVFSSVLTTVGYYSLRCDNEGLAPEDLSEVFA